VLFYSCFWLLKVNDGNDDTVIGTHWLSVHISYTLRIKSRMCVFVCVLRQYNDFQALRHFLLLWKKL